jgi:hypothetical protein
MFLGPQIIGNNNIKYPSENALVDAMKFKGKEDILAQHRSPGAVTVIPSFALRWRQ